MELYEFSIVPGGMRVPPVKYRAGRCGPGDDGEPKMRRIDPAAARNEGARLSVPPAPALFARVRDDDRAEAALIAVAGILRAQRR